MEYIQLGNLVELKQGMAINAKSNHLVSKEETNLALLRIADMPTKSKVIFMSENTPERFIASEDDIIYTRTGQVGLVFRKQQGVVHNNCFRVIPNSEEKLDKGYLYWYLSLNSIKKFANSIASGSAQPDLPHSTFKKIRIWLPHIETQKKLAKMLDQYELLIENNNKRIKLLEQMAENLYKEWFVRFRFPGYETVEFEGKSPKCWNQLRLDQFGIQLESGARPKGGINSSIDDGVPSLGAESVKGLAEFDYSDVKLIPEEFYRKLKRGKNRGNHILIYKDGAYIGKVTLFKYGFPFERFAINEHVFFMNSIRAEYQNYLYFTLKQTSYFTLMQNLNRNAAQPGLSQLDINRIKIIEPDQVTVISFNDIIEPILKKVFQLAKKNHLLIKQRDMLLPRLMSGKLEV